jgi:hypothetical protein
VGGLSAGIGNPLFSMMLSMVSSSALYSFILQVVCV